MHVHTHTHVCVCHAHAHPHPHFFLGAEQLRPHCTWCRARVIPRPLQPVSWTKALLFQVTGRDQPREVGSWRTRCVHVQADHVIDSIFQGGVQAGLTSCIWVSSLLSPLFRSRFSACVSWPWNLWRRQSSFWVLSGTPSDDQSLPGSLPLFAVPVELGAGGGRGCGLGTGFGGWLPRHLYKLSTLLSLHPLSWQRSLRHFLSVHRELGTAATTHGQSTSATSTCPSRLSWKVKSQQCIHTGQDLVSLFSHLQSTRSVEIPSFCGMGWKVNRTVHSLVTWQ